MGPCKDVKDDKEVVETFRTMGRRRSRSRSRDRSRDRRDRRRRRSSSGSRSSSPGDRRQEERRKQRELGDRLRRLADTGVDDAGGERRPSSALGGGTTNRDESS